MIISVGRMTSGILSAYASGFYVVAVLASLTVGPARAAEPPSFKAAVAPLLVDNCIACHNAKKAEGGYRLDTFDQLKAAGDSGEAPIVAGAQPAGEILRRISSDDPDERMPPAAPPLPPAAVAAIRDWLASGATFDGPKTSESLTMVMSPRTHVAPATYQQPTPVTAVAFSPEGTRLFVGGCHEVLVFDVATGALVKRLGNVGQRVMAIRLLADGRTIAVAGGEPGREGDVRLLDVETGAVRNVLARATDVVFDVAPRPGSEELAVGGTDGMLRVIDAASGKELRAISSHGDWVTAVAWSDDGKRLASASRDKTVKVYDATNGELIATFSGHEAPVRGVALSADGKQGFSAGDDKRFFRWNSDDGKAIGGPVALPGVGLRVVRDGDKAFVAHAGRAVSVITLATNAPVSVAQPEWPLAVAVHAASGQMATGSLDGEVRVFTLADGKFVKAWPARP